MPDRLKIVVTKIINAVETELDPVEILYTDNTDVDVELELVNGTGGPLMRPKTPPRL